jgi:hypothetical protein
LLPAATGRLDSTLLRPWDLIKHLRGQAPAETYSSCNAASRYAGRPRTCPRKHSAKTYPRAHR